MKNQISSYQWLAMLTTPVTAILMMNAVTLFVSETNRGAYISALIISVLTFGFLCLTLTLAKRNDYLSPLLLFKSAAGKICSRIICVIAALFFLFLAVTTLEIFIYIVKLYFLPKTPALLLGLILFLPTAYMAYSGFRAFTYMATAAITALIGFMLLFLFTKNNYMPENIFPLTDFYWEDIFTSLPFLFLTAPAIAASFFLLPYCSDKNGLYKKSACYCLGFCLILLFVYAMGMMYFGKYLILRLVLPFYNVSPFLKGSLLERFDIIFMLILLPKLSIFSAFGFNVFHLIQQELFVNINGISRSGVVIFWSAVVILVAALTLDHISVWHCYLLSNAGALLLAIVLMLFYFVAAIKRRKAKC